MTRILVLTMMILGVFAQLADAQVAVSAETSLASTYVFRGVPQYTGTSDPSAQSTLSLSADCVGPGNLSVTLWNAAALRNYGKQGGTQLEFDVSVAYSTTFGTVETSIGYTAFLYPEGSPVDAAHEIDLSASVPNDIVTPSLAIHADPFRQRGVYASFALSKGVDVGVFTFSSGLSLGVSDYAGVPAGLHDVTGVVSARRGIGEKFYAGVSANAAHDARGDAFTVWGVVFMGYGG